MTDLPDDQPNPPTDAERPERRVAVPLEEAARRFGVAPDTLSKRLRARLAPGFKHRGKWHMWSSDVPAESEVVVVSEHADPRPTEPSEPPIDPSPPPSEPRETPLEAPEAPPLPDNAELIAQLRSEIDHLRKLTIGYQEGERDMRRLLAAYASGAARPAVEALVSGTPETAESDSSDVSAHPEMPEEPTTPTDAERADPSVPISPNGAERPEEPEPSRSLWRRMGDALKETFFP